MYSVCCFSQADPCEDIITESGVCYVVTDKGRMMWDVEPDDTTTSPATAPVSKDSATGRDNDDDDEEEEEGLVEVPSILISADTIMDVKKKLVG